MFCLGTYTGVVTDAELRTVTVDYTIEFARVLRASSPGAAFSFLSGNGADPTGRSKLPFARFKGEAEKALLAAGFPHVYIFRPAYIYPVEPRKEPTAGYRLLRAVYPVFRSRVPQPGDPRGRSGSRARGQALASGGHRASKVPCSRTATSEPWSRRSNDPRRNVSRGHPTDPLVAANSLVDGRLGNRGDRRCKRHRELQAPRRPGLRSPAANAMRDCCRVAGLIFFDEPTVRS